MIPGNENQELPGNEEKFDKPARLIDEVLAYIQKRQQAEAEKVGRSGDVSEEHLIRSVLRHLRRHPLPTVLLGISTAWLLLADEESEDFEEDDSARIEDEIVRQMREGYSYTNKRLRDVADNYPLATAAAVVGSGLLAAFLLPDRPRRSENLYAEPAPVDEETEPGEDFGFESPGENEE